jgi:hypothetical protein
VSLSTLQPRLRGAFPFPEVTMEEIAISVALLVTAILRWWLDNEG